MPTTCGMWVIMVAPAYHRHATIAKVVGWRIGREQAKTAEAEEGVRELVEELAELRRELHTGGTRL
jgi:hypothetical protein